jgi:hypothetical protein
MDHAGRVSRLLKYGIPTRAAQPRAFLRLSTHFMSFSMHEASQVIAQLRIIGF